MHENHQQQLQRMKETHFVLAQKVNRVMQVIPRNDLLLCNQADAEFLINT